MFFCSFCSYTVKLGPERGKTGNYGFSARTMLEQVERLSARKGENCLTYYITLFAI